MEFLLQCKQLIGAVFPKSSFGNGRDAELGPETEVLQRHSCGSLGAAAPASAFHGPSRTAASPRCFWMVIFLPFFIHTAKFKPQQ